MSGAFPFRPARPKMTFDLPSAPPEVPFDVKVDSPDIKPADEANEYAEIEQKEELKKPKRRGRPPGSKKTSPVIPRTKKDHTKRFTLSEVIDLLGETDPIFKVVTRISPIIEVLAEDERKRVVEILMNLYKS